MQIANRQLALAEQMKKIQEIKSSSQKTDGLTILDLYVATVKNEEELAIISHEAPKPYEESRWTSELSHVHVERLKKCVSKYKEYPALVALCRIQDSLTEYS
ncbi:hypothetical protein ACTFIW_005451 [Dictyostelium discoideum]